MASKKRPKDLKSSKSSPKMKAMKEDTLSMEFSNDNDDSLLDSDSDVFSDDLNGDDNDEDTAATNTDHAAKRKYEAESKASNKKQKKQTGLIPPTNEELHQLKEAENLFHSSLFRLQVTELLKEVQLKENRRKEIDKVLHKLKPVLMRLTPSKEFELNDENWLKNFSKKIGVNIPLKLRPLTVKGKFCFYPPCDVKVTGSYMLDTCLKPHPQVDVVVVMPQKCFQPKDHLNHRYLRKRAIYLAYLASHLKDSTLVKELSFTYHHGNHFKPILVLNIADMKLQVNLHIVPENGVFKYNRFSIHKNNVRLNWFNQSDKEEDDPPTPFYNTTILQDITMLSQLEFQYKTQENAPGVKDGICLLKVWLTQRGLYEGFGTFSGFLISMYVSYLLSVKKLNKMMSSYQVFRTVLLHLSQSDWTKQPLTLTSDSSDPHKPSPADFYQYSDVVFVDPSGYVNCCAAWTKDVFYRAKHEALQSLRALDKTTIDGFDVVFMRKLPFLHTFDYCFHLKSKDALDKTVSALNLHGRELDRGGDSTSTCLPSILDLLYKALDKRVHLIQVQYEPTPKWKINENIPGNEEKRITFGLLLNPDHASSIVERGPPADSPQAKDFREFWGKKSEIRRFQDGGISEAVVWQGKSVAKKRLTTSDIVKHILFRHGKIPSKEIKFIGGQLDEVLAHKQTKETTDDWLSTGEEGHIAAMAIYNDLCKTLRGFKDLPLNINTIQGTSPVFRFTEVFPPDPSPNDSSPNNNKDICVPDPSIPTPPWTPAMKVVCLLEGSGKWPSNKEAICRLKAAFYIKLSELLMKENLKVKVHPEHVDVFQSGYVFRVMLAYLHEIAVLRTVKTAEGMVQMRDTPEAVALETQIVSLPKFTSTLHGIHQHHNVFGAVSRLAKRWISSQLLSDFFQSEALELIVAHLFLSPAPFTAPNSPMSGFFRFLHLLATFDWRNSPLMVNLNEEFAKEKMTELQSKFSQGRVEFPCMTILTPHDKIPSPWTRDGPPPQILHHMSILAKASLAVLEGQLIQPSKSDYKQIFRPPLDMYDVILHLRPRHLPKRYQSIDYHRESVTETKTGHCGFPVTQFDPLQFYIRDLKAAYEDMALFFYDVYGGNIVGVLWKPDAVKPQPFKVTSVNGRKVESDSLSQTLHTTPNVEAILEDFKLIGGGLVDKVEMKSDQSN